MVLLAEQMRIINRILPIKFNEDEFRLSEELTFNRVYSRLVKLDDHEILDAYYAIFINYNKECNDENNKYLYTLYTILLKVGEEKNLNFDKFISKKKRRRYRLDIYGSALCVALILLFKNVKFFNVLLLILNLFIIIKWKKYSLFVAKKLKVKQVKVQEFKTIHICMLMSGIMVSILHFRDINPLLYLIFGYSFVILLHLNIVRNLDLQIGPRLTNLKQKILFKTYEYGVLILFVALCAPALIDCIGYYFKTSDIRYFKGICTETKDLMFGYTKATINDIYVILDSKNKNVSLGNYYKITYGNHSKAVLKVEAVNVVGNNNDDVSSQIDKFKKNNTDKNNKIKKKTKSKDKTKDKANMSKNKQQVNASNLDLIGFFGSLGSN